MRTALALLALAAVACHTDPPDFKPGSYIDKLRILDITASPPDVSPGDQTLMTTLVVDPYQDVRPLSFLWILCDPDPSGSGTSACARQDTIRELATIAANRGQLPPGVTIVPLGDSAYYRAPTNTFDNFPPGSPQRENGVAATILFVAYEGTSLADLQDPDITKQVSLKRIRIAPRGTPKNHNPEIASLSVNGALLTDDAPPTFAAGEIIQLSAAPTDESLETFDRNLPDGTVSHETEPAVFSWYANGGLFDELQQQSARTNGTQQIAFAMPAFDDTLNGVVDVWVVLRDARGGTAWAKRKVLVAP
jgi:hypothetical protein